MKKLQLSRKQAIVGSLIVGSLLVGGGFTAWALTTNKGVITAAAASAPVHVPAIATVNGRYISFEYSNSYKVEPLPATPSELETYDLTANTNYEKHLAVVVHQLDSGGLSGFTGYTSRDYHREIYDRQTVTVAGTPAIEFMKKDQTEKTIFATRGSKVVLFSFVTTSQYDDINTEIAAILNSFSWKQ